MWMIVAENLLCMRIYIDNYFWEAFIIYVEGHKNSIFADKVILIFSKKKLEANFVFYMLYSCKTKIQ